MTITRVPSREFNGFKRVFGETNTNVGIFTDNESTGSDARILFGDKVLAQQGADPNVALFGLGNSTTRVQQNTASAKFASFYTETTAADTYGFYWRHYLSTTAGISGDAMRAFCTVNNIAAGTARGLHASLSFGTSGTVTGLGCAIEATLHIPNDASQAGTLYGVKSAINSDGATSDPAGATTLAYFAAVNQGDTTGDDDVDTDAVLVDVQGHATGTGTLFQTTTTAYTLGEITNSLKIKVGGTIYHLLASTTGAQAT